MKQNNAKMYTNEDLKTIREALPNTGRYEAINKVLTEMNQATYSHGTIRQVLSGHRKNDQIVLAAVKVCEDFRLGISKIQDFKEGGNA
jgi:hypothetical protein